MYGHVLLARRSVRRVAVLTRKNDPDKEKDEADRIWLDFRNLYYHVVCCVILVVAYFLGVIVGYTFCE